MCGIKGALFSLSRRNKQRKLVNEGERSEEYIRSNDAWRKEEINKKERESESKRGKRREGTPFTFTSIQMKNCGTTCGEKKWRTHSMSDLMLFLVLLTLFVIKKHKVSLSLLLYSLA